MQAKELGKKALKSLKQAFKRGAPEVEAPARPQAPAPAHPRQAGDGAASPKAVPLHGWKGGDAKKAAGAPAGPKIGAKREAPTPLTQAPKTAAPASEVKAPAVEKSPSSAPGKEKAARRHSAPARLNAERAAAPVTAKSEAQKVAPVSKGQANEVDEKASLTSYYSDETVAVPRSTASAETDDASTSDKTKNRSLGALVPKEESTDGEEIYTSSSDDTYTSSGEAQTAKQNNARRALKSPDEESAFEYSNPDAVGPEYVDSEATRKPAQDSASQTNRSAETVATNSYVVEEGTNSYVVEEGTNSYVVEEGTNSYVDKDAADNALIGRQTNVEAGVTDTKANEAGVTQSESTEEVVTNNYVVEDDATNNYVVEDDATNKYALEDDATNNYVLEDDATSDKEASEQPEVSEESESEVRAEPQKALKAPDVQPVVPEHKDASVALLQGNLRKNAVLNKDVKERHAGREREVTRGPLSKTEQKSKGWANLPIRDTYRNSRSGEGNIKEGSDHNLLSNGISTQYYLGQVMKVDAEVRKLLASNLKAGRATKREDTVLRLVNGSFVDAKGGAVDSTHVSYMPQAYFETVNKLEDKIKKSSDAGLLEKVERLKGRLAELKNNETRPEATRKEGIAGRFIFVMNAAGEIFAGQSIPGVVHHSSFLAGGAVAGAGEIAISGGKVTAISNTSGHYRPGPAYLWQTVKQLEMLGVPLESVRVDVMGVSKTFKNAKEFLGAFNPSEEPEMFDAGKAIEKLNAYLTEKSAKKHAEQEKASLENADKLKKEDTDGIMKGP